jgi:hypothetical protein
VMATAALLGRRTGSSTTGLWLLGHIIRAEGFIQLRTGPTACRP